MKAKRYTASWENELSHAEFKSSLDDIDNEDIAFQERERHKQDTKQRKFLAHWVVIISSAWLGSVMVVLILSGLKILLLGNAVLNVLLATTTANVLGLEYIVLKGLFREQ